MSPCVLPDPVLRVRWGRAEQAGQPQCSVCSRLTRISPSPTSVHQSLAVWPPTGKRLQRVAAQACPDTRSFLCSDPGPHFAAAGTRPDAGSGAPAGSGGPGEASGGARACGRGLLAGRHHPPRERRWNQRGHRAAAEGRRCAGGWRARSGEGPLPGARSETVVRFRGRLPASRARAQPPTF